MADAIQKGIEAAQLDLVKDAEDKLLEEVNVHQCRTNALLYCSITVKMTLPLPLDKVFD